MTRFINLKALISNRTSLFFLLLIVSSTNCFTQQLPRYSQYSENIGLINPSAVNNEFLLNEYNASISIVHRTQWQELKNSPQTSNVNGEFILKNENNFSLLSGLYLQNDSDGRISTNGLYARIGVIGDFSSYNGISGLSAGLLIGMVEYRLRNASSIAQNQNDPQLYAAAKSQMYPDVGIGVSFHHQFHHGYFKNDRLQLGFAIPQIFGLDTSIRNEEREFNLQRQAHYYGTLQFTKFINEANYIELSAWMRMVKHVPSSVDLAVRYLFSESIWVGIGYSTANIAFAEFGLQFGEMIGMQESNFKISYSIENGLNTFAPLFGITHEITASYSFSTD